MQAGRCTSAVHAIEDIIGAMSQPRTTPHPLPTQRKHHLCRGGIRVVLHHLQLGDVDIIFP